MTIPNGPLPPEAFKWHSKPTAGHGKTCSVCGYFSNFFGEHRAAQSHELALGKWLKLDYSTGRRRELPCGPKEAGPTLPTEWHRKPPGRPTAQCPTCGLPGTVAGRKIAGGVHRKTRPDETADRGEWILQRKEGEIAIKRPKRRSSAPKEHHIGPVQRTRRLIVRATTLLASGKLLGDVAAELEISANGLRDLKSSHPDLWKLAYSRALENIAEVLREQAGTAAVLEDPDLYMRRAQRADRYLRTRGESLFAPGDLPTMTTFFRKWYMPMRLSDAAPSTVASYHETINGWAAITGDPPLIEITQQTLLLFRDFHAAMASQNKLARKSPFSVNSKLRHLQTVLHKAGPPGHRNRDAASLIPGPIPYIKPLKQQLGPRTIVDDQVMSRVYSSCIAATLPRVERIKPAAWWRALFSFSAYTGLRRRAIFALRFQDVDWRTGRLTIPGKMMKTGRWQSRLLDAATLQHLRSIRTSIPRELLFEWPHGNRAFYKQLRQIQVAAGLPSDQWFGLHTLRRTLATKLVSVNPAAAQLALGHAALAITLHSYTKAESVVDQAMRQIQQATCFAGGAV